MKEATEEKDQLKAREGKMNRTTGRIIETTEGKKVKAKMKTEKGKEKEVMAGEKERRRKLLKGKGYNPIHTSKRWKVHKLFVSMQTLYVSQKEVY
jgi:hypothetical protein